MTSITLKNMAFDDLEDREKAPNSLRDFALAPTSNGVLEYFLKSSKTNVNDTVDSTFLTLTDNTSSTPKAPIIAKSKLIAHDFFDGAEAIVKEINYDSKSEISDTLDFKLNDPTYQPSFEDILIMALLGSDELGLHLSKLFK